MALNRERAREEKRGLVRWLRPDYQIPRFGTESEKARQLEADLGGAVAPAEAATLPAFPKSELEQTAVVMAALANAAGPVDAAALAAGFKPGRNVRNAIAAVLMALARVGVIASADGGRSFMFRRVA